MSDWITEREETVDDNRPDVLVTDFGNVIVDRSSKTRSTPESFLEQRPLPHVIDGLARAVDKLTPERVYIVSRVDLPEIQALYRRYLKEQGICSKTGMLADDEHVRFCYNRVDKGAICYSVQATIVVDDRTQVHWSVAKTYGIKVPASVNHHLQSVNQLSHLSFRKSPKWLRLFGFNMGLEDRVMYDQWPDGISPVANWKEIADVMKW